MRVRFYSEDSRWLRVRPRPLIDGDERVRLIERGCEFEVEGEPIDDGAGHHWYHVPQEPAGYVMAELVTPVEDTGDLEKMKVPELRKLAADSGVELKPGMKKAEIIEAILNG